MIKSYCKQTKKRTVDDRQLIEYNEIYIFNEYEILSFLFPDIILRIFVSNMAAILHIYVQVYSIRNIIILQKQFQPSCLIQGIYMYYLS